MLLNVHDIGIDSVEEAVRCEVTEAKIGCAETMSILGTIFKIFIGSGVLFLPKAFSNGGWLFSVLSMLVMAVITNIAMMKLVCTICSQLLIRLTHACTITSIKVACRAVMTPNERSYGAMGHRVAGALGQAAVNVSVVLSQIGFCCVYVLDHHFFT